jgi:signal transduction histidine kinase/CheY-like chemotaxis protein
MRKLSALAAMPLAILLLTWLSLRSVNSGAELFDRTIGEMDRFTLAEAALHRDVLSARSGMLRNYDPLARDEDALDASLAELQDGGAVDAEAAVLVQRLSSSVARQEDLVEHFKSDNALLQNSLSYFGIFAGRLGRNDAPDPVVASVNELTGAMLRLTLDTSPTTASDVRQRLDDLGARPMSPDEAEATHGLLAHGRLLTELLPATDHILKALSAEPPYQDVSALHTVVLAHQAASRNTARWFRLILYAASLLLLALLAQLSLRLRARALALKRRAALEHVIAALSMRLLIASPGRIGDEIRRALGELAACLGANRAYFLLSCESLRIETWCEEGITLPPNWPESAPALAAQLNPAAEALVHVASVRRLPPGEARDMSVALGLTGWAYASVESEGGGFAAVGFDAVRSRGGLAPSGEFGLVLMALNTIVNALRRETLERDRARLEARVQQAHRMETVGALASGVAHNFNNILGAIMGFAEMAEAGVASDSGPARNLGEIRRAGERARDLVDQLLTFGRRRLRPHGRVDLRDLVAESTSLLAASQPESITVVVAAGSDPVVVPGEPAQLQQVILNLCNNAAQAMDGTGRVDIEISLRTLSSPQPLSHGDLAPGVYARLVVSDAGRGMDGATLERIFEPFFTTRAAGNGLGLATVREIVREHGGAIDIASTPNVGSRFDVWLPANIVDGASSVAGSTTYPAAAAATVLIIDDDRERLLRAEEILAALGFEPVGFARADDALAAFSDGSVRFDLLVLGHRGSVASIQRLATKLHEAFVGLPIVLATASTDDLVADRLVAAGIADVVRLPFSASEMAAALERCFAVSGYVALQHREVAPHAVYVVAEP